MAAISMRIQMVCIIFILGFMAQSFLCQHSQLTTYQQTTQTGSNGYNVTKTQTTSTGPQFSYGSKKKKRDIDGSAK
jgi:hypothetical protein